jgi:biopolymer transport protein ExbD
MDVSGARGSSRAFDHEIPLIPFIDFLLCLIAFLLVTAVWSQRARVDADARVPGAPGPAPEVVEKQLHVEMRGDRKFQLVWKQGNTVLNTIDVPRRKAYVGDQGDFKNLELAQRISQEWARHGTHRHATDERFDQAVLHTDNSTPFQDVVAVLDAISAPERDYIDGATKKRIPAFNVTFAVN